MDLEKYASEAYSLVVKKAADEEVPVNPYSHYISKYVPKGAKAGVGVGATTALLLHATDSPSLTKRYARLGAIRTGIGAVVGGLAGSQAGLAAGTLKAMKQNGRVVYNAETGQTYMK
jgi:hypothetical protein